MDKYLSKDYPSAEYLTEDDLDENQSLKKIFYLLGDNQRVVDFGCASGYLAQLLNKKGCIVTGVDINPDAVKVAEQYCKEVIVADLDFVSVTEILPSNEFDVAVFGDVLEHLRNPWKVLEETKQILKKDGYIVASIPNIAHGAIRLSLLEGRFEYVDIGILDNTHLRFFTRKTVQDLLESCGYILDTVERTKLPIFAGGLVPIVRKEDFSTEMVQQIEQQEESETLQFVIKAFPLSLERKLKKTQAEFERSQLQLEQTHSQLKLAQSQIEQSQAEFERSQLQLQQAQAELERLQLQLQQAQAESERSHLQLQQAQAESERSQLQLQLTQKEDNLLKSQLQQTQRELELSNGTITAMETSKFWKLRVIWFKFKALIKKVISVFKKKAEINLLLNFRKTESYLPEIDITIDAIPAKKSLVKSSATVDVIICVHNALDDVKLCLESVLRYSRMPYSLILVDDGSREETCKYLSDFANSQNSTLIRNQTAKGYTFAANQGLKYSQAEYAILLNSDTIVTPGWLDRIVACGESDRQIGIIGPLSNTASWQSIPEISHQGDWAENKLPEGISIADMGILVAEYSNRLYPRIPFLNGFCLAIKRSLIEDIGYFDEDTFAAGYGEENDYCLRARQAGWQLAIADDTYVYHSQSRSYSNERRKELCDRADKALVTKHGQQVVSDGVSICRFDRVLEGIRIRTKVMLKRQQFLDEGKKLWEGKRVLIILPIMEPGGGSNVIFQEGIAMQKMGVDVRILNFSSHRETFEKSYPDSIIPIIYVEKESQIAELLVQYDAVVATLYKSVYWLDSLVADANLPIKGYYIQDFEPYFFPNNSEGFKTAWKSYTHYPDLVRITKTQWNHDILKQQIGVESSVIGPSVNLDLFRPRRRQEPNSPQRPLRIAAMIRPSSPRRNAKLTMQVLQKIYQKHGNNIEIIIFGCSSDEVKSLELKQKFPWDNKGILTCSQLAFLLNEIDIFADFSTFQAMGLTAMEAMACGVAVIVPEKGGASSFAKDKHNSLIVNTSSEKACFNSLNLLILDENLRLKLQQQGLQDICQYFPEKVAYNTLKFLFNANH